MCRCAIRLTATSHTSVHNISCPGDPLALYCLYGLHTMATSLLCHYVYRAQNVRGERSSRFFRLLTCCTSSTKPFIPLPFILVVWLDVFIAIGYYFWTACLNLQPYMSQTSGVRISSRRHLVPFHFPIRLGYTTSCVPHPINNPAPFPFQSRRLFSSEFLAYLWVYFMYGSFYLCFQTPEVIPCDWSSHSGHRLLNYASDSVSCTSYIACTHW